MGSRSARLALPGDRGPVTFPGGASAPRRSTAYWLGEREPEADGNLGFRRSIALVDRNELERHLRSILESPETGARVTEAKMRALDALRRLDADPDEAPDGALLTPRERATLDYLLTWGWDVNLWDAECTALVLKLGIRSQEQIDADRAAVKPKRKRAR